MSNVYGPYDTFDWLMMKKMRENLDWYKRNNMIGEGYQKEKNIYLHIVRK